MLQEEAMLSLKNQQELTMALVRRLGPMYKGLVPGMRRRRLPAAA